MLDRIDLHVEVTPVSFDQMTSTKTSESSSSIKKKVIKAREFQEKRFENHKNIFSNAMMDANSMKENCIIDENGKKFLKIAMERLGLSARAYDRILKVSRTIADLANSQDIAIEHLAEAIPYRSLDRESWTG